MGEVLDGMKSQSSTWSVKSPDTVNVSIARKANSPATTVNPRTQAGTGEGAGAVSAIAGPWESVIGGVFDQISPATQSVPPRVGKHPEIPANSSKSSALRRSRFSRSQFHSPDRYNRLALKNLGYRS